MSMTAQYMDAAKTAQERWASSLEAAAQSYRSAIPAGLGEVEPATLIEKTHASIEQFFGFWNKALQVQKDLAMRMADANIEYLSSLQTQASAVASSLQSQVKDVAAKAQEAAGKAQDAMVDVAEKAEATMTSAARSAAPAADKPAAAKPAAAKA